VVYRSDKNDINYTRNFYNLKPCTVQLLASNDPVFKTLNAIEYEKHEYDLKKLQTDLMNLGGDEDDNEGVEKVLLQEEISKKQREFEEFKISLGDTEKDIAIAVQQESVSDVTKKYLETNKIKKLLQ
jgi:hypothetical protein